MKRLTIVFKANGYVGRFMVMVKEEEVAQTIAHLKSKGYDVDEYALENIGLDNKSKDEFYNACNELMSYLMTGREAEAIVMEGIDNGGRYPQ